MACNNSPYISQILIYPVKSCRGVRLSESALDQYGMQYDRIYMLVQPNKKAPGHYVSMSQKRYPKLARLLQTVEFNDKDPERGHIIVQNPDTAETIKIPLEPLRERPWYPVRMPFYPRDLRGGDMGDSCAAFFSTFMKRSDIRLAYRDEAREVYGPTPEAADYTSLLSWMWPRKQLTACTDAAPLHFITQDSLDELSLMSGHEVEAWRFRPNFVLKGVGAPWVEEEWKAIDVPGAGRISVTARCPRCSVPDVDIETGKRHVVNRPGALLKAVHQSDPSPTWGGHPMFGMWAMHHAVGGKLKLGTPVKVVKKGSHSFFYPFVHSKP